AAGTIDAGGKAGLDRVGAEDGDNRDRRARLLSRPRGSGAIADRNNNGRLAADEVGGERRQAVELRGRVAILDGAVAALDKAVRVERVANPPDEQRIRGGRSGGEPADHGHLSLLRPRHQRPRRCRGADAGEEFAPSHELPRYSITSSARTSTVSGTVRPSALAVFMLSTVSYFTGACTGRSAGFPPLKMRRT